MAWEHVRSVGIIGAGVAGLATARILTAQGIDCTVFDRADRLATAGSGHERDLGLTHFTRGQAQLDRRTRCREGRGPPRRQCQPGDGSPGGVDP